MRQHLIRAARRMFSASLPKSALGLVLIVVASALAPLTAEAASAPAGLPSLCRDVSVPATIDSGPVRIFGRYCRPLVGRPTTVQLLVHGATYNHTYWDFPGFGGKYSYVQAATRAGYATFAVDRLGAGRSSHPPSQDVTYDAQISTLHQVVQALRHGVAAEGPVRHVEYIGHSFGSAYGIGEVAKYHDVDALILSGYGHQGSAFIRGASVDSLYPANDESRFAGLDDGYVTTKPGYRDHEGLFYATALADPKVIAADEATKDTSSLTEFLTRPVDSGTISPGIHVPTLIIDGQEDVHYCTSDADDCTNSTTLLQSEAPYFDTCLSAQLVQSGHNINLHETAPSSYQDFLRWSYATLPPYAFHARCAEPGAL